jgi:hypothetical protein
MAIDIIFIRRLNGEFELPTTALNRPEVVGREGKLYKWRCNILLDDERTQFEAESFYQDKIPKVWYECNVEQQLGQLAEIEIERLLKECYAA